MLHGSEERLQIGSLSVQKQRRRIPTESIDSVTIKWGGYTKRHGCLNRSAYTVERRFTSSFTVECSQNCQKFTLKRHDKRAVVLYVSIYFCFAALPYSVLFHDYKMKNRCWLVNSQEIKLEFFWWLLDLDVSFEVKKRLKMSQFQLLKFVDF